MLKVLTRPEAAKLLRVSVRTLDYLTKTNQVPLKKIGRSIRFSEKALEHWIEKGEDGESIRNEAKH